MQCLNMAKKVLHMVMEWVALTLFLALSAGITWTIGDGFALLR